MALLTESRVRAAAREASTRLRKSASVLVVEAAKSDRDSFDVFLSHSVKDAELVLGTAKIIEGFGMSVYVDWINDPGLDRTKVKPETAALLRHRMGQCKSMLYLKSTNSVDSTWMPWELGYFDGLRGQVGILPIAQENQIEYNGNEYLGLYPYVDIDTVQNGSEERLWINRSRKEYGLLQKWLSNPREITKRQ